MPRGQPRLSFRELTSRSREATILRATGLSYRKIAARMQVPRMTAWRWVHWHQDMTACFGHIPRNRGYRLPFRAGLGWDQARYEALVAQRQKVLELIKVDETMKDASETSRNSLKDRRDSGMDFVEKGGPVPAWLVEAIKDSAEAE